MAKEIAPKDPDGVISGLSEESAARYNGYTNEVHASAWADWKPDSEGPYKVGIVMAALNNPHQQGILDQLEKDLAASPLVSDVVTVVATGTDASAQLQQYRSVVQQGVDIVVYQPYAADAFVDAVDSAAAEGIPSVAVQTIVPSDNSVNVVYNTYAAASSTANQVLENIGGTGNILGVHGLPGIPVDEVSFTAFNDAIAQCPDAKLIGEVTGGFDSSAAKSEVLTFLSTYTGDIAAVFQTAVMAPGIISAFDESGLTVPGVTDIAAQQGSLAYWNENRDAYTGAGAGQGSTGAGNSVAEVVLRMLAGGGVKVTDVIMESVLITDENLDDWVDPSWTLASVGTAPGPAEYSPLTEEYLTDIFNTPTE